MNDYLVSCRVCGKGKMVRCHNVKEASMVARADWRSHCVRCPSDNERHAAEMVIHDIERSVA